MKITRCLKIRLYPTEDQKVLFVKTFGCRRFVYNKTEGEYHFKDHLYCEDEEEIVKIIQPFKDCIENRKTLNVTSNRESKPFTYRYYVIQVFKDNHWGDVLFSRGNICTAK